MVSCGEVYALGLTPLLPSAGRLSAFPYRFCAAGEPDPTQPGRGAFLLHYGDEADVTPSEAAADGRPEPGVPAGVQPGSRAGGKAVRGEEPWLRALGVTSVGAFNEACVVGSVSQIIRVSEGLHEKRIGQIADAIAERAGRVRVICIAGPSSSGKTTFIKRLTIQLQVNGVSPVAISLDDYYRDRDKTRRDARGEPDFEAPEALDLDLLRDHVRALLEGEAVTTARFDFLAGKSLPAGGPTIALRGSDMLLLEGIHGLNPWIFASILDRSQIFRVFIQPATGLPFDRLTRVNVSDMRLLRRIVRDRHQRGTNASANIQRWPSVRAGEQAHIFPYLGHADAVFDSALVYELSVIKVFADRYLLEVPQDHPAFVTSHRLRQLLDRFITIYPDHVPPTSILREFIGGSGFEY
jgi:uridine kinase